MSRTRVREGGPPPRAGCCVRGRAWMRGGPGAGGEATRPARRATIGSGDDRPSSLARPQVPQAARCEGQVYTIPTTCTIVSRAHCAVTALRVPPYFLPSHFITLGWISSSTQCMGPWERGSPTSSLDHGIPSAAQPRVEESTLYRTCAAPTMHV